MLKETKDLSAATVTLILLSDFLQFIFQMLEEFFKKFQMFKKYPLYNKAE